MNTAYKEDERMQADVGAGLRTLASWAAQVKLEDIPQPVLGKAVLVIADNVGAMVAARDEPEVKRVHQQLMEEGGRATATVFRGGRPRTDRISAALANGIAGSWCELDEGSRLAPCHAGLYTLPALLAEAETLDMPVGELLRAIVVAYEVNVRAARCWAFPQLTLHPHPQSAAIGGAAASGVARGFDADLLFDAVTAAASLTTAAHFRHAVEGALVRNVWAAVGTANGMRAADWARCGIGGSPTIPYATYTELLGVPPQPAMLTAELGTSWAITQGYHKIHGCCQSTHAAVDAMLEARERLAGSGSIDRIERIEVETHRPGMSNKSPSTTLAARFSFDHVVAAACVYGHAGVAAFSDAALANPDVARLRERVTLRRYEPARPWPHDRAARVTLHLRGGEKLVSEALSARGGPDKPFDEAVILDKVSAITGDVYPRFVPAIRTLRALEPAGMRLPWRAVVNDMTAS